MWCPNIQAPVVWLAYWNKFGIPEKQPDYIGPDTESWWIDPDKESALGRQVQKRELMTRRGPVWKSDGGIPGSGRGAAAAPLLPGRLFAESPADTPLHGLSAFGDLKYAPDFTHFGYLNPDAPKGGTLNFSPPNWQYNQNVTTFNTLNTSCPAATRRRAWRCATTR